MTATTDNGSSAKKSFFLTLEHCKIGDTRPLSEVLNNLRFNDQGLIPAVAQDSETGEVLMLAWMNSVAVKATLDTGQATYFSRSRNELWVKGKTSGHIQQVVELRIDCDGDALLCLVNQRGSACHTNRRSCFYLATDLQTETVHVTN